jgi:putative transposase
MGIPLIQSCEEQKGGIPMPALTVVRTLPQAERVFKEMELREYEFGDSYREACNRAAVQFFEGHMERFIDDALTEMQHRGEADRRNGSYTRHLLTEVGDLELHVPRTRTFSAVKVLKTYARYSKSIEQTILAGFLLGLSTRKISKALFGILGEPVSPSTVSRMATALDQEVVAFHRRPLADQYRALILDGVFVGRRTGAGAVREPVLVALGIRFDGRKEIIDFRLARSESEPEWTRLLLERGLTGQKLEIICLDGGKGLRAAIDVVYPGIDVQRCWAHKMRNLTDGVRKIDRKKVKKALQKIYIARTGPRARQQATRFASRWGEQYPKVVRSLRIDLDELLAFHHFKDEAWRKMTRTTNAIERRFREVRRRTRPMGTFYDKKSVERIMYGLFSQENKNQRTASPFLLTQTI